MNNKNNLILLEGSSPNIKTNKQIIPLFNTPLEFKEINLKKNKYNIKLINLNNISTSTSTSTPLVKGEEEIIKQNNIKDGNLNEILSIYLRGINLYNNTLINLLNNNNKLKLIKELKYDEYNKLNIIYNNYLYLLNRYLPILKFRSVINKLELFADLRTLKYNKIYTLKCRLGGERVLNNSINNNKIKEININMISKLLEKGDNLNTYLNFLINKKKLIINKNKLFNLLIPVKNLMENQINKNSLLLYLKLQNEKKRNYDNLLSINNKKLNFDLTFNNLYKNNEMQIRNTRKSILNYLNFENSDVLNNNISFPINIETNYLGSVGTNYNKPIINQYLKEMSKFNMSRKGIFIKYSNIIGFNFNNNTNKLIKNIYKLLFTSFKSMYCLISKPVFIISPDKITIQLFYYLFVPNLLKLKQINLLNKYKKYKYIKYIRNIKELKKKQQKFKIQISKFRRFKKNKINLLNLSSNALTKVFSNKFKILCNILSNLFKKPVELNLTRLHYPYFDSNILVNLLGIMINKIKLRIIIRKLFQNTIVKNLNSINLNKDNNIIPAFLSGINIKVAGRLLTQRVVPRKTVKTVIRGASARSKVNFLDVGRYSNKNKRGAFSITVKSGQNYF